MNYWEARYGRKTAMSANSVKNFSQSMKNLTFIWRRDRNIQTVKLTDTTKHNILNLSLNGFRLSGPNLFRSINHSGEVLDMLKSRILQAFYFVYVCFFYSLYMYYIISKFWLKTDSWLECKDFQYKQYW